MAPKDAALPEGVDPSAPLGAPADSRAGYLLTQLKPGEGIIIEGGVGDAEIRITSPKGWVTVAVRAPRERRIRKVR